MRNNQLRNIVLGYDNSTGELVWIPKQLRYRHLYNLGRTGAGKSALEHRLIHQDAKRDYGVVILDSGDLATALTKTLPDQILNRGLFFSFEQKRVIPYNPLLRRRNDPGRLENEVFDLIDQIAAEASNTQPLSARMKRIVSVALRAILQEKEPTLSSLVMYLLERQDSLREQVQLNKGEFTLSLEGVIDRLSLFLKDDRIRRVICAPHQLNFDNIIDEGRILLISLAGLEKAFVRFLGTILLNGLWATILERPPERRKPVAIYIDEFQDYLGSRYAVHNFQTIFTQGRRYKASLCVAHQDFGTIDSKLLHTIHANAASVVSFSCGPDESTRMNKIFGNDWDLGFLPDHKAVARVGQKVSYIQTYPPPKEVRQVLYEAEDWSDASPPNPLERATQKTNDGTDAPAADIGKEVSQPSEPDHIPMKNKAQQERVATLEKGNDLSYEVRKFLIYVSQHPGLFVTRIYKALGLSGYMGDRIKQTLVAEGLIVQDETRQGAGGRLAKSITVTEKGLKILDTQSLPGKGGELHKQLQLMIKEQAEILGWRATVEERIEGTAETVDIGLERDEVTVAVEISVTTDADNEIQNIQKCLAAGYDYVICAVSEEKTMHALKTKGRRIFPLETRRRIRYGSPSMVRTFLQEIANKCLVSEKNKANSHDRIQKQLLSTKEAAEVLGVSSLTLYSWVSQRKIPYLKSGKLNKFKLEELHAWLEKRRKEEEDTDFV